ncbi:hypothetical protein A0H76_2853 [Hepatospora eriocheir]|uniref:Uncharacterized protein n=1 Tax=Hepatospora eriocheir TaxID=1081669 RepID=A0A1X0Q5E5_9MICR|nr:hypothetical protein A0H76_2853 [Hepatospora eriocheir]
MLVIKLINCAKIPLNSDNNNYSVDNDDIMSNSSNDNTYNSDVNDFCKCCKAREIEKKESSLSNSSEDSDSSEDSRITEHCIVFLIICIMTGIFFIFKSRFCY